MLQYMAFGWRIGSGNVGGQVMLWPSASSSSGDPSVAVVTRRVSGLLSSLGRPAIGCVSELQRQLPAAAALTACLPPEAIPPRSIHLVH